MEIKRKPFFISKHSKEKSSFTLSTTVTTLREVIESTRISKHIADYNSAEVKIFFQISPKELNIIISKENMIDYELSEIEKRQNNDKIKEIRIKFKGSKKQIKPILNIHETTEIKYIRSLIEELISKNLKEPKEIENKLKEVTILLNKMDLALRFSTLLYVIYDKFDFSEYGNNIQLFLYDNLKKLKETKLIDSLNKTFQASPYEFRRLYDLFSDYYIERHLRIYKTIDNFKKNEDQWLETLYIALVSYKLMNLSELDLTQFYINHENILILLEAMKINYSITKLTLNSNKIGNEGLWGLGQLLKINETLKEVDLSQNMLNDLSLTYFLEGLDGQKTSLKSLNLSNNYHGSQNLSTNFFGENLSKLITLMPCLEFLNISKNNIEEGFQFLMKSMFSLIDSNELKLKTFIASQVKIDPISLSHLGDIVAHPNCPFVTLVLADNKLNNEGGYYFFTKMQQNKSIKELILFNCDIDNDYSSIIYQMIKNNSSLISVVLYNNLITNPDNLKQLIKLCSNCDENICEDVFMSIDDSSKNSNIKQKNKLRNLDLSKNKCVNLRIDYSLIELLKNLDVDILDISQNIEGGIKDEIPEHKALKSLVHNIQNTTKIII